MAQCRQGCSILFVDIVIGAVTKGRDDKRDDGQEQYVGTEEDEAGEAVVAVSLAVAAAYPHQDTCQSSTCEKHSIPQPYLSSHGVIEGHHSNVGAAHFFLQCRIGVYPGWTPWIHRRLSDERTRNQSRAICAN